MITQSAFWRPGNGLATRTRELLGFLARETELSVVYLNPLSARDMDLIRGLGVSFRLFPLADNVPVDRQTLLERFRNLFHENSPPAAYLVVQTEMAWFADAIPANGLRLLDTNDLISDRTVSMAAYGAIDHFPLTRNQEIELLQHFDKVICIQETEYQKVCRWLGADRVILAPHPVAANPAALRGSVKNIGFAASGWHANIAGLKWFVDRVWPQLSQCDVSLDIYGLICGRIANWQVPRMRLCGVVGEMSECHSKLDIFINPILYGAGLKIKTVEAMAAGLPIVTTLHGAGGLQTCNGIALLVARDESEFAAHILRLLEDHAARIRLGQNAVDHVRSNFSESRCFEGILSCIKRFHESPETLLRH